MTSHDQSNTFTASETKLEVPPPLKIQLKNKKESSDLINNKKEGVNSLQTVYTSSLFNNNILDILQKHGVDQTGGETFGSIPLAIRVPASIYNFYRLKLTGEEQKIVRELLKQFFVYLVSNSKNIVISLSEQKQIVVNPVLNVLNIKQENVNVSRSENVLRLKREIDRLNRELERVLSENLELKKQISELQNKLSSSTSSEISEFERRIHRLSKELDDHRFHLAVAVECLNNEKCDKQLLLDYLRSKTIEKYEKPELVHAVVKQLVIKGGV